MAAFSPDFFSRENYLFFAFVDTIKSIRSRLRHGLERAVDEKQYLHGDDLLFDHIDIAMKLIRTILKGDYRNHENEERLMLDDRHSVDLSFASSGQMESLWIIQIIFLAILDRKPEVIFVEEPEAHLFPEAQKDVVALMALFLSAVPGNQIVVTTHSPYILSAINNLLFAHGVGRKRPGEVAEVVDPKLWLDPKRVAAYFVENGGIRRIMDDELGMIQAEEIDSVSRIINAEFDRLFELEHAE
ncbi:MAG: AAA family ATPase [Magnetococcales bacterium]|nr:AAA family ATPase [Magnetococcales bacterium]